MIRTLHERRLAAPADQVGKLLESLAGVDDRLWPVDRWPAMRFERPLDARVPADPLRLGADGGHGLIRYQVSDHRPGRLVAFSFCPASGLIGGHRFEVVPDGPDASVLRHVLEARPVGKGRLSWPLLLRPLHDALIEEALDRAEAATGGRPRRRRSLRVELLRALLGIRGRGPEGLDSRPRAHEGPAWQARKAA